MTSASSQATPSHEADRADALLDLPSRALGAQVLPSPLPPWNQGGSRRALPDLEVMARVCAALRRL